MICKRRQLINVRLFSWLILIVGCFPADQSYSAEVVTSQDLVIALSSDIVSFDPTNYRDRTTQIVMKSISDSLTTRNEKLEVVPHLAESWKPLDDTTWEFRLRQGVHFHNGDLFTANDVKFTLDRVITDNGIDGNHTSPRKELLSRLDKVVVVDDYTVRLITAGPWPILPLMLSLQEIMPQHYINDVGMSGYLRHPVGTGPFSFSHYRKGSRVIVVPNPDYFAEKPARLNSYRQLVFLIEPSKVNQIVMLKRRQCDIIFNISPGSISILEKTPGVQVLTSRPTRSYFAAINVNKAPYNDVRVRRAFNLGLDIQVVIDHVLYGHGRSVPCIMLPDGFGFHPTLQVFAYEPETAKKLLVEAGFPFDTVVRIGSEGSDRPFANLIAAYLTRLGLKTVLTTIPQIERSILSTDQTFDILVTSWGNTTFDPIDILNPTLKSDGEGNIFSFHNAEIDRLLTVAEVTMDDEKRAAYYHLVQEIIQREAPFIFGYAAEEFYAIRNHIENFNPSASGMISLSRISIEPGK